MRNVISLNKNWAFIQENAGLPGEMPTDWHKVDLPHTWNAVDGHDGNGSYDRGTYWYAKTFETPKQPLGGGNVYVEILAAGSAGNRVCKWKRSDISRRRIFYIPCGHYRCVSRKRGQSSGHCMQQ